MAGFKFSAESQPLEKLYTKVDMEGHELFSDQPESNGGSDRQACPVSIMVASIAACESMITRKLSEKMRLNIKNHRIAVDAYIPEGYEKDGRGIEKLHISYIFDSEEPDEKLEKLVANMAKLCPIVNSINTKANITHEIKRQSL